MTYHDPSSGPLALPFPLQEGAAQGWSTMGRQVRRRGIRAAGSLLPIPVLICFQPAITEPCPTSFQDYWDSINLVNGRYEPQSVLTGVADFLGQLAPEQKVCAPLLAHRHTPYQTRHPAPAPAPLPKHNYCHNSHDHSQTQLQPQYFRHTQP